MTKTCLFNVLQLNNLIQINILFSKLVYIDLIQELFQKRLIFLLKTNVENCLVN